MPKDGQPYSKPLPNEDELVTKWANLIDRVMAHPKGSVLHVDAITDENGVIVDIKEPPVN